MLVEVPETPEMSETWAKEEMVAVPAKSARARSVLRGKRQDSRIRTKISPDRIGSVEALIGEQGTSLDSVSS
jgi:hypothetical protein